MKSNYAVCLWTILFVSNQIFAQPGSLDYTFGQGGKVTTNISQLFNFGYKLLPQPDGKIIQIGFSAPSKYHGNFSVVRYDTNGSLDATFGINGIVETSFGIDEDVAFSGVLQPDGKIIAAGYSWNGTTYDFAIVRYSVNGSRDMSFGVNGIVTTDFANQHDRANQVVLQSDGKILLVGFSGDQSSVDLDLAFARYNSNGSLDNSFGNNGKTLIDVDGSKRWQSARAVTLQSDGKIVVTGFTDIPNQKGSYNNILITTRLNPNGAIDYGFGVNGTAKAVIGENTVGISIKEQPDGKLLVLATSKAVKIGGYEDFVLARYLSNGTLDNGFGNNGIVITTFDTTDDIPGDLLIQPDGKILAIGTVAVNNGSTLDFAMARYNPDGSLDNNFGNGGKVKTDFAGNWDFGTSVILQKDGKVLIGGYSRNGNDYDFALARYNNDIPLPVVLVSFDTKLQEDEVHLSWETELEINSDYFEIQRSADGKKWVKIGNVESNKNADSVTIYHFADSSPSLGINMYRLKMVDLDRTFTYSNVQDIMVASNDNSDSIEIYPNPAREKLIIKLNDWHVFESVRLFDKAGREIFFSQKHESIDLKNIPSGDYVILISMKDGSCKSQKVMVQR